MKRSSAVALVVVMAVRVHRKKPSWTCRHAILGVESPIPLSAIGMRNLGERLVLET